MLPPITIQYAVQPARRSLITGHVADLFGLAEQELPHVIAENVMFDIRPSDLVLFTGPSGSGKSSLLRAVAEHLHAVDAMSLNLPEVPWSKRSPARSKNASARSRRAAFRKRAYCCANPPNSATARDIASA